MASNQLMGAGANLAFGAATGGMGPLAAGALGSLGDLSGSGDAAPATSAATSGDATSGNATGGNTSGITGGQGITFGGITIGPEAFTNPAQFSAGYTSRRLATGQTAAAMPATPVLAAPASSQALAYTSSVTASPMGLILTAAAGLAALIWFARKK